MLQLTWLFIGALAALATAFTLRTADDQTAIMSGLIGMMTWLLWGYSALNVIVYDGSGNALSNSYPALAALGVMLALPNLFVALTGPLAVARDATGDYAGGEVN